MSHALSTLTGMFYEPGQAFATLRRRSYGWLPAALVTFGMALIIWWYYQTVDFGWLVDHQLSARPDLSASQRATAAAMMRPRLLTWGGVLGVLILTPLLMAMYALVYFICGKFVGSDVRFGQWCALAAWSNVPRVLCFPLMIAQILGSRGQVGVEDLTMVSMNFLFLHLAPDSPWFNLANAIDLTVFWSIGLAAVGIRAWTGRGPVAVTIMATLPPLLLYAGWAGAIVAFS